MKITKDLIEKILADYDIHTQIEDLIYFIEYYPKPNDPDTKVIAKVLLSNHAPLVIKLIHEQRHCTQKIEAQSTLSESLRSAGILTPRRYTSKGQYCIERSIENIVFSITLEDYIGEEIKAITLNDAREIGALFGRMHCIAETNHCHIHYTGIFDLMDWNEVTGYINYLDMLLKVISQLTI